MTTPWLSTPAKPATCPRCGAAILTAHDEGLPASVDATPLADHAAEIAALLAGMRTYTQARNKQLIERTPQRLSTNNIPGTIHAEHKCVGPQQETLF